MNTKRQTSFSRRDPFISWEADARSKVASQNMNINPISQKKKKKKKKKGHEKRVFLKKLFPQHWHEETYSTDRLKVCSLLGRWRLVIHSHSIVHRFPSFSNPTISRIRYLITYWRENPSFSSVLCSSSCTCSFSLINFSV